MSKILKDKRGLYSVVGDWVVRPIGATQFLEGDEVKGKNLGKFNGAVRVGMGELPRKGSFKEYWRIDKRK